MSILAWIAIAPCPGDGTTSSTAKYSLIRSVSPNRCNPAAANTTPSRSSASDFRKRVSTLPRILTILASGLRRRICTALRRDDEPITGLRRQSGQRRLMARDEDISRIFAQGKRHQRHRAIEGSRHILGRMNGPLNNAVENRALDGVRENAAATYLLQ